MTHPSTLPVQAILDALPEGSRLNGLWVQWHGDGTERARRKDDVIVSIQYDHFGNAIAEEGIARNVRDAAAELIAALRPSDAPEKP